MQKSEFDEKYENLMKKSEFCTFFITKLNPF